MTGIDWILIFTIGLGWFKFSRIINMSHPLEEHERVNEMERESHLVLWFGTHSD